MPMMRSRILISILILSGPSALARVTDPCTSSERWTLLPAGAAHPSGTVQTGMSEFAEFTSGREPPMTGLSRAIRLGRIADLIKEGDPEREFSEYWISRALYDLKLPTLAHRGFRSVLERTRNPDLQRASWICLARIQGVLPDLPAPEWPLSRSTHPYQDPFTLSEADAITPVLIGRSFTKGPAGAARGRLLALLPRAHQALLSGLSALEEQRFDQSISTLKNFTEHLSHHPGIALEQYHDEAWLSLGRALYSVARFKEAADAFQRVHKTSNLEIEALSNLSWAYLASRDYESAIGIGIQLRSGGLRSVFAPEPLMVSAMALHELCRYPDSVRMIAALVNDFGESRAWLEAHPRLENGYALALAALKGAKEVPAKVSSEWIRSPHFQRRQLELNEMSRIPARTTETRHRESLRAREMTRIAIRDAEALAHEIRSSKGTVIPSRLLARYQELKRNRRRVDAFRIALREFSRISESHLRTLAPLQDRITRQVNRDLAQLKEQGEALSRTLKMFKGVASRPS
ncbi:MAG: hypothetical protein EBX52_05215 [Proteobacteria bacterium]|nr:hypothetical protein [Pseudomonadota bacterium]